MISFKINLKIFLNFQIIILQIIIDAKLKVASGNQTIVNDSAAFMNNFNINSDTVKKTICLKDLESKNTRIARLKIKAELTGLDKMDPK